MAHSYNNRDYSDITLKFADREIKAHKVILCTNSQYFKKLCGAGSQFEVRVATGSLAYEVCLHSTGKQSHRDRTQRR